MKHTLAQIINQYKIQLKSIYDKEELDSIIFIVSEHVLGFKKTDVILQKEKAIDEAKYIQLVDILNELKQNKPIQYILGQTAFYGMLFKVNRSVLIPRQETEELVDWILKSVNKLENKKVKLLDIGTGSGCIAIALKKYLPEAEVFALDISAEALATAKENAQSNGVSIHFIQQDILNKNSSFPFSDVDIIVSNPPYVRHSEKTFMQKNVLNFEPHLALFVEDENALVYYEAIADFASKKLIHSGFLFFEINEEKGAAVCEMLEQKGFTSIELKKDMNEKDRMVKSCRV